MELEKQVCSLELAKRLKKLGVKQESYFEWRQGGVLGGSRPQTSEILPTKRPPTFGAANEAHSFYSAFTVAELGDMLPEEVEDAEEKSYWFTTERGLRQQWRIAYRKNGTQEHWFVHEADTEADARAKMLIYLLESKLITV